MIDFKQDKNYLDFLIEVKNKIREAQYNALKKINKELIDLYCEIGKIIVFRQKKQLGKINC